MAKNDANKEWRSDWLSAITKTRVLDKSFKELIAKDRVYTCERHFASDNIEICKYLVFIFSFSLDTSFDLYNIVVKGLLIALLNFHEIVSDMCLFILFAVTTEKMIKKKPRFGALPTLNMPIEVAKARSHLSDHIGHMLSKNPQSSEFTTKGYF